MAKPAEKTWQPLWDDVFSSRSWGAYPSEDLIRFIARNYYNVPDRKKIKILDMGAGTGANTLYLAREGFDTYALDGSSVAIDIIAQKMERERLATSLQVGDIANLPYEDSFFDCIVELNCLMCNDDATTAMIIKNAADKLKPGGRFFSMSPKTGSWGYGQGKKIGEHTYTDAKDGPYTNLGLARFMDKDQIPGLYAPFHDLQINLSTHTRNNGENELSFWVIDGMKS